MKKYSVFAVVMLLGGSIALASTVTAPFFRSVQTGNDTSFGLLGIKNNEAFSVQIDGTYTALDASDAPTDQLFSFGLGANESVSWDPILDDASFEGTAGAAVPNMTIPRLTGSVALSSPGSISGRYTELKGGEGNNISAFGHVLLPL